MTYDLLEEPWIPLVYGDGEVRRAGVLQALRDAGKVRQVAASNPLDRVAILRFLLALLYWCRGSPAAGTDIGPADLFPQEALDRLKTERSRFDLFGERERFYQYREPGDGPSPHAPSTYLMHEIPSGTNKWHFRHSTDGIDGLCPSCCALGLVRLPVFTTMGGRGYTTCINGTPPIYAVPLGSSLAGTLELSWRPVSALGSPAWMEPNVRLPDHGEVPVLSGLTWLPWRVWLDDPEPAAASCVACGREAPVVRRCVRAGKPPSGRPTWHDPHTVNRDNPVRAANALEYPRKAAGQWSDLVRGLAADAGATVGACRSLWVVALSSKQAICTDVVEYELPPASLEHSEVWVRKLRQWQEDLKGLARQPEAHHRKLESLVARHQIEPVLPLHARALLALGEPSTERILGEFDPLMGAIASSLAPEPGVRALQRRREAIETLSGAWSLSDPSPPPTRKLARRASRRPAPIPHEAREGAA